MFSDYQKQKIEEQKKEELERQKNKPNNVMTKGKPLLGGPFVLVGVLIKSYISYRCFVRALRELAITRSLFP